MSNIEEYRAPEPVDRCSIIIKYNDDQMKTIFDELGKKADQIMIDAIEGNRK